MKNLPSGNSASRISSLQNMSLELAENLQVMYFILKDMKFCKISVLISQSSAEVRRRCPLCPLWNFRCKTFRSMKCCRQNGPKYFLKNSKKHVGEFFTYNFPWFPEILHPLFNSFLQFSTFFLFDYLYLSSGSNFSSNFKSIMGDSM